MNYGIMGIEQSQLQSQGIEIEEKVKETSDHWTHHTAIICGSDSVTNLSVFVGESFHKDSLWRLETPLQKNIKNLMVYRHPCIIKYVSSWQKNSKFYLTVEDVKPLSYVISELNSLQISIGLYSILKALCFLHEKALVTHNNVCVSSIYVGADGSWKLGGMEFLCKYSDLTPEYLVRSRRHRYSKAVDSNEDKLLKSNRRDLVDILAFSVLATELLKSVTDGDIPSLAEFRSYCEKDLKNLDVSKRPTFRNILEHAFFDNEFIKIHSFLLELPLKVDCEKAEFFKNLGGKLRTFDEGFIGSHLSGLLLSRLVLLNDTAQTDLLPQLLSCQKQGREDTFSLFSEDTFKKYLCPKLIEIFKVRDVQIRLLLLDHFHSFIHAFSSDELQLHILPELLVGIKDTNDGLVSATLRSLADLVSILGSAVVIGNKRAKLFNDGRPTHSVEPRKTGSSEQFSNTRMSVIPRGCENSSSAIIAETNISSQLPERSRPDGGEEETSTEEVEQSVDEDAENWEDWDVGESNQISSKSRTTTTSLADDSSFTTEYDQPSTTEQSLDGSDILSYSNQPKKSLPSTQELDIKSKLSCSGDTEDIDFFQDMEPVIKTSNKFIINETKLDAPQELSSKFTIVIDNNNEDGWDNAGWD